MSDARWNDSREYDARDLGDEWPRVYDTRDRDEHDPRDGLMRDLDLPRGDERDLVVDRDRVYELNGEDSLTLAVAGAFRVVPEQDLDLPRETLENLHDQRLVEVVNLGRDENEVRDWAREHDLPYFDDQVHFPDYRIEYELDGRELHQDVELFTPHYRGAHAASHAQTGFRIYVVASRGGGGRSGPRPRGMEEFL
jgi:hypothetical protein